MLEARRLRGLVEQKKAVQRCKCVGAACKSAKVGGGSIEYRKRHNSKGLPWGNRINCGGAYFEDMRPGGHVGQGGLLPDSGG